jgi:hypothetical protein
MVPYNVLLFNMVLDLAETSFMVFSDWISAAIHLYIPSSGSREGFLSLSGWFSLFADRL